MESFFDEKLLDYLRACANFDDASVESHRIEMAQRSPRIRSTSLTSRFYDTDILDQNVQTFINTASSMERKNIGTNIKQSRHLPIWAWYIITKCLGISLERRSKPILGTILHGLTFAGALTFAISYSWYVAYDIISPNTPRDIPGGSVSILLVYFWCGFGFYCKDLSSRLFLHSRFIKDIRLHSRTVFKMNGALVICIIGMFFTTANVVECLAWFPGEDCQKISLEPLVCHIMSASSIVFSIFTLVWHSLVSFIFMSVCRTHTIGLRRFIKEIEYDASVIEHHLSFSHKFQSMNQEDIWQESLWIAEDENDEEYVAYISTSKQTQSFSTDHNLSSRTAALNIQQPEEINVIFSPIREEIQKEAFLNLQYSEINIQEDQENAFDSKRLDKKIDSPVNVAATPHTMTSVELVHHFWKLNCRLRFSSYALQRWYASFGALVLLRCSTYLVHWLTHPATIFDMLQFILPLIILVILSTAIAEVNFEGQRVLRSVYPKEERIRLLQYMALNPLQMSIYGFGMTHGTIVTVVFAMLVGFVTKIIITEMTK